MAKLVRFGTFLTIAVRIGMVALVLFPSGTPWPAGDTGAAAQSVTKTHSRTYTSSVYKQPPGCPPFFADGSGSPPTVTVPVAGATFTGWWMGTEDRHTETSDRQGRMKHWLTIDIWCLKRGLPGSEASVEYYKLVATTVWMNGQTMRMQGRAPGAT